MSKTKVISKGYTLTVSSWENDGDYSRTESETYEDLDTIKSIINIFKFTEELEIQNGFWEDIGEYEYELAEEFLKENSILIKGKNCCNNGKQALDLILEYCYQLMGGSETYMCRVMDKYTITYSPEDVYLETINI